MRALVLGFAALAACGGDDGATPGVDAAPDAPPVQAISIAFAAEVGGMPFVCGQTYTGVGANASPYQGADFRFYVHDVRLFGPAGDTPVTLDVDQWQSADGIALLDFEDGTAACQMGSAGTHTALTGTVPPGTYTGVAFTVGVPFAQDHLDATTATSPLDVPAMYWSWSAGYKFLKVDGVVNGLGFNLHVGSTGCNTTGTMPPTAPCDSPNLIDVRLAGFTPGTSTVVTDIARVLTDVNVSHNTTDTAPGCMSFPGDPECDTIFPKLGLAYGTNPPLAQRLFTLR